MSKNWPNFHLLKQYKKENKLMSILALKLCKIISKEKIQINQIIKMLLQQIRKNIQII